MNHSSMIATTLSEAYSFPTNSLIIKNIIYHHMNKTVLITGASSGIGAEVAYFAASAPEHMQVAEILVMPTNQATGTIVSRK